VALAGVVRLILTVDGVGTVEEEEEEEEMGVGAGRACLVLNVAKQATGQKIVPTRGMGGG
jgi:hypothetical protein